LDCYTYLFIGFELLLDKNDGMKVLDLLDGLFIGLNILFFYFFDLFGKMDFSFGWNFWTEGKLETFFWNGWTDFLLEIKK